MPRKYKVQGTNDFLYFAIGLFALCVWAVRDGWFPTQSRLEKNPLEVSVAFEIAGRVGEVLAEPGQKMGTNQVAVVLEKADLIAERDTALAAYDAALARSRESAASTEEIRSELERTTEALRVARERLLAADVRTPSVPGTILEMRAVRGEAVQPKDIAFTLRPTDSFYLFNKSLAILSFIGALVCAALHLYSK